MGTLIRNGRVRADNWRLLEAPFDRLLIPAEDGLLPDLPQGLLIVPLAVWLRRRDDLVERAPHVGLCLATHEDPQPAARDLPRFGVIAVRFADFTDGRGYSLARSLREEYGYSGELRAIGDVRRDQLHYLASCGFDAFDLRKGEDPVAALKAFADFSETYQASVAQPSPLFRRRLAGAHA